VKVEMKLPPNLLSTSVEHFETLDAHVKSNTPESHQVFSHPKTYPMSPVGTRLLEQLRASHNHLKEVEAQEPFNDVEELNTSDRVEKNYMEKTQNLLRLVAIGLATEQTLAQKVEAEREYSVYYFPEKSTFRYRLERARQAFLDNLGACLTHLKQEGMPAFW